MAEEKKPVVDPKEAAMLKKIAADVKALANNAREISKRADVADVSAAELEKEF